MKNVIVWILFTATSLNSSTGSLEQAFSGLGRTSSASPHNSPSRRTKKMSENGQRKHEACSHPIGKEGKAHRLPRKPLSLRLGVKDSSESNALAVCAMVSMQQASSYEDALPECPYDWQTEAPGDFGDPIVIALDNDNLTSLQQALQACNRECGGVQAIKTRIYRGDLSILDLAREKAVSPPLIDYLETTFFK